MILAVLADIHGNLPALEAVLGDARRAGAELFLVAGDLLTGAPYPAETLACLRELPGLAIRGNVDQYLLDYSAQTGDPALQRSARFAPVRWTFEQVGPPGLEYLGGLPEQAVLELPGTDAIRMVHGSPRRMDEGLVPDRDPAALAVFHHSRLLPPGRRPPELGEALAEVAEPLLVCGHTHIPWVQAPGAGKMACNPGSVGLPINNDARAQYLLLRRGGAGGWRPERRAVEYDRESARRAYAARGLLEEGGAFARACLANLLSGQNAAYFLVRHWQATLKAQGADGPAAQERAWHSAARTFDWETYGV